MLIWLHARDSTQSSLHSSFCTLLFLSVLWVPTLSFPDNTMFVRYLWCFKCLFPSTFLPLIFFLPHSLRLWHGVMLQGHFSARSDIKRFFFIIPADRGITVSLSVSDAHTHFRDQQVISQPVGSPGVIPEQFTDKSDTAGQKALSYLASVSACSTYSTQGGDENQHCGLCSAAESSSIKLTWIFTHFPSGTCWSWAGLTSN